MQISNSPLRKHARRHSFLFEQWLRKSARKEYRDWLRTFGSADAFKESVRPYQSSGYMTSGRRGSYPSWVESEMRRSRGTRDALSQMRAHLKVRWRLPSFAQISA